jgi:TPR repeat protein
MVVARVSLPGPARLRLVSLSIALILSLVAKAAMSDWNAGVAAYLHDDYSAAFREFKPLAEQGSAPAQNFLGLLYEKGEGVQQNTPEALHWYEAATAQGHAKAAYNLGVMYETGGGVPVDFAQAAHWYALSAKGGYPPGQTNLGYLYETGEGLPRDFGTAAMWYRAAADQGYAIAEADLGFYYADGTGVERDQAEAYFWLMLSLQQARLGARQTFTSDQLGTIVLQAAKIEQGLSREQRDAIDRRLKDWHPTGNYLPSDAPLP